MSKILDAVKEVQEFVDGEAKFPMMANVYDGKGRMKRVPVRNMDELWTAMNPGDSHERE